MLLINVNPRYPVKAEEVFFLGGVLFLSLFSSVASVFLFLFRGIVSPSATSSLSILASRLRVPAIVHPDLAGRGSLRAFRIEALKEGQRSGGAPGLGGGWGLGGVLSWERQAPPPPLFPGLPGLPGCRGSPGSILSDSRGLR